mgnify:CR=1 FL=1
MKRIIRLDASAIKESHCFRKLYLLQQGYREKKLNNDIHYGTCFHKCAEEYERTGGDEAAAVMAAQELWREQESSLFVKPSKKYLTLAHLTMACQMYIQQRKSNTIFTGIDYLKSPLDGIPLVEQKASVPLYEDDSLLILLQGTIDGICRIKNGCVAIADWKTTASYDVEDYFLGYKLSPQLKTYYYLLDYYRRNYPSSPLGQLLGQEQIGAFIYGAFLSAGAIVKFERSQLFWFNKQVMDDYEEQLQGLVIKIRANINAYLPSAEGSFNGTCVGPTGFKCKYFGACAAEAQMNGSSELVYHYLNSNFKKVDYKPLEFGGGNKNNKTKENEKNILSVGATV